ncbi:MAG: hypothetical protein U0531_11630 [Dehalococcoidia bacterium]
MEERLAGLDAAVDALRDRDDELSRQVALLDGRQKGFQERLTGLLGDIATYLPHSSSEQFQRLHQLQERHPPPVGGTGQRAARVAGIRVPAQER